MTGKLERIKTRYVVKSNHLITRVCQLSPQSQKLFCLFVALMNSNRAENNFFWLTLREIATLLGIENWKDYRKEIVERINELQEGGRLVWLNETTAVNYISGVKFEETGIVYFEFPELLRKHVGQVSTENYTKFQLSTILPLKGSYSLRLYELIKKEEYKRKIEFDIEYLRKLLDIPKDKYIKIDHFKKRVIIPALNEINSKTDLQLNYTLLKAPTGKSFIGIQFFIESNEKEVTEFREKIKSTVTQTNQKTRNFEVPDAFRNSTAFNTVYKNFVEHSENFPSWYIFEDYINQLGFKIVPNRTGGKDIIAQTKMNI